MLLIEIIVHDAGATETCSDLGSRSQHTSGLDVEHEWCNTLILAR